MQTHGESIATPDNGAQLLPYQKPLRTWAVLNRKVRPATLHRIMHLAQNIAVVLACHARHERRGIALALRPMTRSTALQIHRLPVANQLSVADASGSLPLKFAHVSCYISDRLRPLKIVPFGYLLHPDVVALVMLVVHELLDEHAKVLAGNFRCANCT